MIRLIVRYPFGYICRRKPFSGCSMGPLVNVYDTKSMFGAEIKQNKVMNQQMLNSSKKTTKKYTIKIKKNLNFLM